MMNEKGMAGAERRYVLGGLTIAKLEELGGRCHTVLDGRFITVLLHQRRLYALDSPCYHAAGPLGEGAIVDIEDVVCIRCPWHQFLVDLDTGDEITRLTRPPDFSKTDGVYSGMPSYPMEPLSEDVFVGPPVRGKRVQRVHRVGLEKDEATGDMEVVVFLCSTEELSARPLLSDAPACHPKRGAMSMEVRDIKARGLS